MTTFDGDITGGFNFLTQLFLKKRPNYVWSLFYSKSFENSHNYRSHMGITCYYFMWLAVMCIVKYSANA